MSDKKQAVEVAFSIVYKDPEEILKEVRASYMPEKRWPRLTRAQAMQLTQSLFAIASPVLVHGVFFGVLHAKLDGGLLGLVSFVLFILSFVVSLFGMAFLHMLCQDYAMEMRRQHQESWIIREAQRITPEVAMNQFYGKQLQDMREQLLGSTSPIGKIQAELEQERRKVEAKREQVRIRLLSTLEDRRRAVLEKAESLCTQHLAVLEKALAAHSLVISKAQALLSELELELKQHISQVSREMGDEELLREIQGMVAHGEELIFRSEVERKQLVRQLSERVAEVQATLSGLELQTNPSTVVSLESHERFIERAEHVAQELVRMSG